MIKLFEEFVITNDIRRSARLLINAIKFNNISDVAWYLNIPYKLFLSSWQRAKKTLKFDKNNNSDLINFLSNFRCHIINDPNIFKNSNTGIQKLKIEDIILLNKTILNLPLNEDTDLSELKNNFATQVLKLINSSETLKYEDIKIKFLDLIKNPETLLPTVKINNLEKSIKETRTKTDIIGYLQSLYMKETKI